MQQSPFFIFLIPSDKVKLRPNRHIWSRNRNIFIFRNIYTRRIILFIIHTGSNRETRDGSLSMIENSVYIRRENRMIVFIHHNCRISPPKKCLGERCPIINFSFYFDIRLSGIKSKTMHPFRSEHPFYFITPNGFTSIRVFFDRIICRQKCWRTMMLWPIKFYTTWNPRTGKSHKSRFYNLIVIYKMTFLDFIVGHLHTTSELW